MNIPKPIRLLPALLLVLAFGLEACAGSAPPPSTPSSQSAEPEEEGKDGKKVQDPKKRNEQRPANRFL